ncbi:MAG TPA: hypothetical protein VMT15_18780 [Bryobacteraceae bacterium]|nr:hypothetical protein [Bryobacteraceae bacterium]
MELGLDIDPKISRHFPEGESTGRRPPMENVWRGENIPGTSILWTHSPKRLAPAKNPLLSRVDFLSAANQADASAPVGVAGHQFEEQRGLGGGPFEFFEALLLVPRPLCLVKNNHVFIRGSVARSAEAFLQKIIDVLNAGAYVSTDLSKAASHTSSLSARIFVSSQCLAKYGDQRSVSGEVNNVSSVFGATGDGAVDDV